MREKLRQNPRAATLIVCALGFLLVSTTLSACSIEDLIRVDVPKDVAESIGTTESIPVSESSEAWEDWIEWVERTSDRFAKEIDDSNRVAGVIRSLTETGLSIGQDAASTLPGGALISSGLALAGGLFLRRPGDDKKERKAAEDAYNTGMKRGKDWAEQAMKAVYAARGEKDPDTPSDSGDA
mgnify:FL=1